MILRLPDKSRSTIARLEEDDETVDRRAVSPSPKEDPVSGQAKWKRCARISSWPDCNSSPLARGRIHLRNCRRCHIQEPCMGGADHTFRRITSCSIALSSDRSATIFLSLPFSSSSWRSRFISDGVSPLYFLRQL